MTSDARVVVPVALPGREYEIHIGRGVLGEVGAAARRAAGGTTACVVTDANVGPLHGGRAAAALGAAGFRVETVTVPAGEASKSLEQVGRIYRRLAALAMGRDCPIVAVGGGVVGDLAGFVAATWLRGVPVVQCPTTVEAAVDASVGGKTGVNLPAGKNLVGAFHQPAVVLIDIDALGTLRERDFRAGLAESVKHALVRDEAFLGWHEAGAAAIAARRAEALVELVRRNCEIKAAVVVEDERERGGRDGVGRAALNFGHTIGHALEAALGHALRHGECVGLGMLAALRLGEARGVTAGGQAARVQRLLASLGLPTALPGGVDAGAVMGYLARDKKAAAGRVRFVMVERPGVVRWVEDLGEGEVRGAVKELEAA